MANIRNSINLQDRMTPVFRSIIKAMDNTMRVMKNLDKQANNGAQSKAFMQATKSIQQADNALIKFQNHAATATKEMNSLANSAGKVGSKMSSINGGGFNLVNLSAGLYLLKNIEQVLSGLMAGPDEAISTKARLGLFNSTEYSKDKLYEQVYRTALETRSSLEDTGNLITRIMISGAMEGPGATEGAIKATGIINKAIIAGGSTAEESRRALLQLSQGLASGVLQGDELRSIREMTPYLMKVLAEGLGKVDPKWAGLGQGDLKALGKSGELTSEVILKAMFAMEDEVNRVFKEMPKTFGQAMTQMTSVWQYFLSLLNTSEGAIGKVRDAFWKLANYLMSSAGNKFMEGLATGMTALADLLIWVVETAAKAIGWLNDNIAVLQAGLIGLATVIGIGLVTAMMAFYAACWPLLVVWALVTALSLVFLLMGATVGQVIGFIVGAFFWLVTVVWDAFMLIATGIVLAASIVWNVFQGLVLIVYNSFVAIGMIIATVFGLLLGVVQSILVGIITKFDWMAQTVLGILLIIAKGIDALFGSNLADSVGGWMDSLGKKTDALIDKLDPKKIPILQDDAWKNAPWLSLDSASVDLKKTMGFMLNDATLPNPAEAFNTGMGIGQVIDSAFNGFKFDLSAAQAEILNGFNPDDVAYRAGLNPDGGKLDEVGKIGSDVNISDEDLKMLKDISAREFLLQLSTITPTANVSFGDVRETADVSKIMDAINQMVEDAFATSLVAD